MTLTYEKVLEYLPAYAIGALDTEDQEAVNEYFRLQEELQQKLTRAQNASTLLARGVDNADMPMDAKERVMARVRAENPEASLAADAQVSTQESTGEINDDEINDGAPENAIDSTPDHHAPERKPIVSPLTRKKAGHRPLVQRLDGPDSVGKHSARFRDPQNAPSSQKTSSQAESSDPPFRRTIEQGQQQAVHTHKLPPENRFLFGLFNKRSFLNAALAASVAAMVLFGGLSSQLYKQTRELSQRSSALRGANSALMEANAQIQSDQTVLQSDYADLEAIYQEVAVERLALIDETKRLQSQIAISDERITLVGAASQATIMFGTDAAPGLQGTFFHQNEEGALVVHGLKPLPVDQTYQFWLVTENGDQVSAGLFAVSEDIEPTWANLVLPQNVPEYNIVGVTVEPATGSVAPTGPMLLESIIDRVESSS